ncbi:glycosyl hydrolase family 18 protein [Rufibacter ruber]|uniref:glycosyl hydrolase family 18 protein n=1 Tax=Rufibacter ruber TaxID=1783499 RepID=UPI00082D224D|nr:glycosyl hydrolase family 18 protein [Rufibacter ruber]
MKKIYFLFLYTSLCSLAFSAQAQSTHEEELNRYRHLNFATDAEYDQALGRDPEVLRKAKKTQNQRRTGDPLSKKVFGWHPYWQGEMWNTYDFSNLHTIAWFSYEVNPSTGEYSTIRSWNTTGLIQAAHSAGVKVVLTVTNFGEANNAALLNKATSRETLISTLISLVKSRGGDGVNIDFEFVAAAERNALTSFMNTLADRFHAEIPGSRVSIALPASFSSTNAFDVAAMTQVDDFLIMGYDYWYAGSPTAGPVAPLGPSGWDYWGPSQNLTRSVDNYLTQLPAAKVLLALPFYGRRWATESDVVGAASKTQNSKVASESVTYATAKQELATKGYVRKWNSQGSVPYYIYQENNQWFQTYYDDVESLGLKLDLINSKGLAGMGIWALGYDKPSVNPEVNALLRAKFPPAALAAGDELETDSQPVAYPNPVARGQKMFLGKTVAGTQLFLSDAVGRTYPAPVVGGDGSLTTQQLAGGLYFLTISSPRGTTTHRVVVVE